MWSPYRGGLLIEVVVHAGLIVYKKTCQSTYFPFHDHRIIWFKVYYTNLFLAYPILRHVTSGPVLITTLYLIPFPLVVAISIHLANGSTSSYPDIQHVVFANIWFISPLSIKCLQWPKATTPQDYKTWYLGPFLFRHFASIQRCCTLKFSRK